MKYLDDEDIYRFHRKVLNKSGGVPGVREPQGIESAISRPKGIEYPCRNDTGICNQGKHRH